MKRYLLLFIIMCGVLNHVTGQEAEKFRFDIRLGYAGVTEVGDGVLLSIEPKWNITKKMNFGLRIQAAGIVGDYTFRVDDMVFNEANNRATGIGSYLGTYDYYYRHKQESPFAAFIGGGLGYYGTSSLVGRTNDDDLEIDSDGGFGGMIRTGFDYFKFRVALEYNLVPSGNLRNLDNTIVGESSNSYLGFSLGFYFGGGKWKRSGLTEG